jgi:two-component system repressor protein LuxO
VRELENAIRTAVVLHDGDVVSATMLPATVREGGAKPAPAPTPPPPPEPEVVKPAPPPSAPVEPRAVESTKRIRPLAETEREAIEEAVRLCGGNIAKAAAFLGISPSTLYRKQESWRRR